MSETERSASHLPVARSVGLFGATGVGVGAIVGGGILVLAGTAFQNAGPSALVAFAINGVIAILTALSFAEMSTAFPESGGAYTFAKKVLSVRAAFAVGWILWFAYIVAAVLYAMGFASYVAVVMNESVQALGLAPRAWLSTRSSQLILAIGATLIYTLSLIRQPGGGGEVATWGKVLVFAVLILAGAIALVLSDEPGATVQRGLSPFFAGGGSGLLMAMGFTFIALQGFDLIAAIAGEIRQPSRTIPRAMLLSLGAALIVYLPLILVVSTVGVPPGDDISAMSRREPDTVMATAVKNYMGTWGYWLVLIAAVLSTMSALRANLLAASRVALSMARDRTLPVALGQLDEKRGSPVLALYASALALVVILMVVPDLAAAGAAASLIFLTCFALAHWTSYLARVRGVGRTGAFQTPYFPAVPVIGFLACAAMATFQAIVVPAAGAVAAVWVGLGVLLYLGLFSTRAQRMDASVEGQDPELVRLRGQNRLILVPVANPDSAAAMVRLAHALAPSGTGKVLLLTVTRPPGNRELAHSLIPQSLLDSQKVLDQALSAALKAGQAPEALITVSSQPLEEIIRVAREHRCAGLLLGRSSLDDAAADALEAILAGVPRDVAFLHAPDAWRVEAASRILIPVGGRGLHSVMRARILGSLCRDARREVTWLRTLPESATQAEVSAAERQLSALAADSVPHPCTLEVVRARDVADAVAARAETADLVILGLARGARGRRVFGSLAPQIARRTRCATLLISHGG